MSEPTGEGQQHPEADRGDNQDQTSGSVFNDPTAPVWADPTAPIPATPAAEAPSESVQDTPEVPLVPPAPPGAAYPYGQPSTAPQATAPAAPPVSNPYAQQPPAPPYAQQPPAPPYPAYGQQYYATGATTAPSNTSAIVLTIVSGVSMLSSAFFVGIPSLIFGIMALTSNSTDPVGSRKKAKTGWIIYAVNAGIVVLLVVAGIAFLVIGGASSANFNSGY